MVKHQYLLIKSLSQQIYNKLAMRTKMAPHRNIEAFDHNMDDVSTWNSTLVQMM